MSVRDDLQTALKEMQQNASSAGLETVEGTIATLKPKQAKELIWQLLNKGEVNVVARMLTGMADSKRAKIIAEFKSETEPGKDRRGAKPHPRGRAHERPARRHWEKTSTAHRDITCRQSVWMRYCE